MVYFKDFLYDDGPLRFYIDEPGKERVIFYVEKTNDFDALPLIDASQYFGYGLVEILKKIIEAGNLETPVGNINVSNGFFISFNRALIPITQEVLSDIEELSITSLALANANSNYKPDRYLDYYYTNLNIDKLKEIKEQKEFGKISFLGFDNSENIKFSYKTNDMEKMFAIKKFCGTTHYHVYVPCLFFENTFSKEEIKEVINRLLEIKYLDFGSEVGKISFNQIIICMGEGKYVPITNSTKDMIDVIFDMSDKEYSNRKNGSRWLKRD